MIILNLAKFNKEELNYETQISQYVIMYRSGCIFSGRL